MSFKEYSRVVRQKKSFFLPDLSAPVYYNNIASGVATPYSDAILLLLNNLKQLGIIYADIWLSWRLLDVTNVALNGGGVKPMQNVI
ncbi:MAG: hypothetical protein ACXV8Q_13930 [Methylobacter sp.]